MALDTRQKSVANDHVQHTTEHNADYDGLVEEFQEELRERDMMFVGRPSEKERQAWNPFEDIKEGSFVCINPSKTWEETNGKGIFWIVQAIGFV